MIKDKIGFEDFKQIIKNIQIDIEKNKRYLCELDSVIGDGDHGTTVCKGFNNAIKQIEVINPNNISDLLQTVGSAIIDTVGGVSGIIFGSLFVSMGQTLAKDTNMVGLNKLVEMFEKALDTSIKIGKGTVSGEKTMVDALYPAVQSLKKSIKNNFTLKDALKDMEEAASKGAVSTKDMVATKGRARYLGERSLGFQDPGATTVTIIISAFNSIF
jgi:phosphoenolpyruvate---glycerone phosphotransferase subunit DhaL